MRQSLSYIDGFDQYSEWLGTAALALAQPLDRGFVPRIHQQLVTAQATQRDDPTRRDILDRFLQCVRSIQAGCTIYCVAP
jgi:hypothetical protein